MVTTVHASDGSSTLLDLNLDNNDAGAGGVYHLETANQGVPTVDFNFGVVDRAMPTATILARSTSIRR